VRLSTSEFCGTEEQQWSCLQVHVYRMMARQLIRHAHCNMLTIVSMAVVWPAAVAVSTISCAELGTLPTLQRTSRAD